VSFFAITSPPTSLGEQTLLRKASAASVHSI
jgi:hypothetical protein